MDEGYPGNLQVTVTYTLTSDNALRLDYQAVSDQETVINLTNHSYFNLAGHGAGRVDNQEIMIEADEITSINDECILMAASWLLRELRLICECDSDR
jgi:aldose 1-epimerase